MSVVLRLPLCAVHAAKKKVVIPKFPLVKKQLPVKALAPPAVGTTPAVSGAPITTGVYVGRRLLEE